MAQVFPMTNKELLLCYIFLASNMAYPACIINGAAVTKTFQIMYKNEEVRLEDFINFKVHAIIESGKVTNHLIT